MANDTYDTYEQRGVCPGCEAGIATGHAAVSKYDNATHICESCSRFEISMLARGARLDSPGFVTPPAVPVPAEPAELERWRARYAQELLQRPHDEWSQNPVYPGGAEAPWRN